MTGKISTDVVRMPADIPLAFWAIWTGGMASAIAAGAEAWAKLVALQVTAAGKWLELEQAEALAHSGGAQAAVTSGLRAVEEAAERMAYMAEEVLTDTAGPLVPLPE